MSRCLHPKYSDGHCGEMICPNYSQKCPKHSTAGREDEDCTLGKQGYYTHDGGWKSTDTMFRDLTPEEVEDFRRYARENEVPPSLEMIHPVCKEIWGV